jgi:glycerol kinase
MLMNTGSKLVRSKAGLLTTVAWQLGKSKPVYALEGGAFICGAAVQWLRDGLGVISSSSEVEELAGQVEDAGGVEFVPALAGLGAPYWDQQARGNISGLTRGTTKAHLARATLEAMALQNADILLAMQKDLGKKMRKLRVDGGASANNMLMQMQADYLGVAIDRPQMIETTAAGAAFLAGLGVGFWPDENKISKVWQADQSFESKMTAAQRRKRFESGAVAIKRSRI